MERRKHPRFKLSYRLKLKGPDDALWQNRARTDDISKGGLRISADKLFAEGEMLKLKITKSYFSKPIEAEARVMWVRGEESAKFLGAMGLEFTHIRWTDVNRILP